MEYIEKWIAFFKDNPPLRDHLNTCLAQIPQSIYNSNLARGQKALPLEKFIIDYKKAKQLSRKQVDLKLRSILGGLAKKGKSNG